MPRRYHRSRSGAGSLFGLILLLTGVVIAVFGVWRLYPQLIGSRFGKFDRFNVVVSGPDITLVSMDVAGKTAVAVKLPDELYLTEVIHGYGQYKAGSVFAAGQLDRRGGETLAGTVQEFLGVPVDGYLISSKTFGNAKGFFLSPDFLLGSGTNLSLYDRVQLALFWTGIRFDKVRNVDLQSFSSPLVLADGSNALTLDKAEADSILSGLFLESSVQAENLRVEVLNSTKVTGLGARATRLLSNIGMSVINVETATDQVPKCQINADKGILQSKTVARIAYIYSCKIGPKSDSGRAAISVVLGKDFADWLNQ